MRSRFCSLWAPSGLFITARTCTCTCTRTVQPYTVTLFRTKVRKYNVLSYESTFVPSKVSIYLRIFEDIFVLENSTVLYVYTFESTSGSTQAKYFESTFVLQYSTLNVYTYVYYLRTKVHLYNNPTTTLSTVLYSSLLRVQRCTVVVRVQLYTINVYEGTKVRKYFRKYESTKVPSKVPSYEGTFEGTKVQLVVRIRMIRYDG